MKMITRCAIDDGTKNNDQLNNNKIIIIMSCNYRTRNTLCYITLYNNLVTTNLSVYIHYKYNNRPFNTI